jgi:hypothetical protein
MRGLIPLLINIDSNSNVTLHRRPLTADVDPAVYENAEPQVEYRPREHGWEKSLHARSSMNAALLGHYRCPDSFAEFGLTGSLSDDAGYFRFGQSTICYGQSVSGFRARQAGTVVYDVLDDVTTHDSSILLPFNPTEVIDNLRLERYATKHRCSSLNGWRRSLRNLYYTARPLMHATVRQHLQRAHLNGWRNITFPQWPVDTTVENLTEQLLLLSMKAKGIDRVPFVWFWPKGAASCVVMTHDVESERGYNFCDELMDMDACAGIKASFQMVPEGSYKVSETLLQDIRDRGFEINIQDLNHDGHLFSNRPEFIRRAQRINQYKRVYAASGFRAAVLYRNPDWYHALDFSYDMSVPNVAHLDPQRGGCCTVMPYFIEDILEIPLTTTQDYMLFHLLCDYSLDMWKTQTEAILKKNGLISFLVHPDYVIEQRARDVYWELLRFLRSLGSQEQLWFALPGEVDQWWRARSKMHVAKQAGKWRVEGPGSERAVLAFANAVGDHLEYEVGTTSAC